MRKVVGSLTLAVNTSGSIRLRSNARERVLAVRLWATAAGVQTTLNSLLATITLPLAANGGVAESDERSITQAGELIAIPFGASVDIPLDGIDEEFTAVDIEVTASNDAGPTMTVCAALVVETLTKSSELSSRG